MSNLIAFIKKEFIHIIRDVRTLIILFGIPITQILMFGYVISNDVKDVKLAVLDYSRDSETQKIINKLDQSEYFQVVSVLNSEKEIESSLQTGTIKAVVVFGQDFGANLYRDNNQDVQLILDASEANTASMITNYMNAVVNTYLQEINKPFGKEMLVTPKVRMVFNEELDSAYSFVPGTMALILMLISAMMTSITIAREKETGTMEVLLVSPLSSLTIILGKVLPYVILSFVNAMTIIAMGYFVFDLPMNGNFFFLMTESVLFISVALSLGILISTLVKTQQVAMFISIFTLMLPTIILSGFIFPVENMPLPLQVMANFIPAKWYIIIVKDIMLKGLGFTMLWKETLILCGFMFFFIAMSMKKFKNRLE